MTYSEWHEFQTCKRKAVFDSPGAALRRIASLRRLHGIEHLHYYPCPYGEHFHLTTQQARPTTEGTP